VRHLTSHAEPDPTYRRPRTGGPRADGLHRQGRGRSIGRRRVPIRVGHGGRARHRGGGPYALTAAAGKVVVINFWATWCGPCKTETPQLDALSRQLTDVDFVGVDVKELSRDAANAFITDNKISYPILWDEPGKTALQLGHVPSTALPFTVVIDKQQRVAAVYLNVLTPGDLQPVLTSLVAEQ
jgi:thiol-disulfide isomerase/thioredoxin